MIVAKLFILVVYIVVINGCWRCPDKDLTPLAPKMEEYFGVYRPGNWWVYYNKARDKKDSVYIVDYIQNTLGDRASCTKSVQRKFTIKNSYLSGNDIAVTYEAYEPGTIFDLVSATINFFRFVYYKNENKIISEPSFDNPGNNAINSIILNGASYNEVLFGRASGVTYYFSKNKGLIGWGNNQDTFNLVNYRIL